MKLRTAAVLATTGLLAACGGGGDGRGSSLNPFTWLQREPEVETLMPLDIEEITDPRPLVTEISDVALVAAPGGAILRAVGLPATEGYFDADLVVDPDRSTPGLMTLQFRAAEPLEPAPIGTAATRAITAATFLSNQTLAGLTRIDVLGAASSRSIRP